MTYQIDNLPYLEAAHYTKTTSARSFRLVVIHDMEAPEKSTTAESVAQYFHSGKVQASAHLCADNDSIVRCVQDKDIAWAAPGANSDGLQIEMAGYAKQTRTEWLDNYSQALLERVAEVTAEYCLRYNLPPVKLTQSELKAGKKGIVGHADVSAVYKKSSHTDPGSGFPWDVFIAKVQSHYNTLKNSNSPAKPAPAKPAPAPAPKPAPAKPAPAPAASPSKPKPFSGVAALTKKVQAAAHLYADGKWGNATDTVLQTIRKNNRGSVDAVKRLQKAVGAKDDGAWGPKSQAAYVSTVEALQKALGVKSDGAWGAVTDRAFLDARNKCYMKY